MFVPTRGNRRRYRVNRKGQPGMAAPFPIRIRGDAYRNQNSQRSPGLSRDHLLRSQHPAVYLLTVGPRGGSGRLFFAPSAAGNRGSRLGLHVVRRGEVDAVAVTWISSLGRTRKKLIKILATLQKHNVALITTEENLRYQLYLYGLDTVLVKHTMRKADERSCPTA